MAKINKLKMEMKMAWTGKTYAEINNHFGYNVEALTKMNLNVSLDFVKELEKYLNDSDLSNVSPGVGDYALLEYVFDLEERANVPQEESIRYAIYRANAFGLNMNDNFGDDE